RSFFLRASIVVGSLVIVGKADHVPQLRGRDLDERHAPLGRLEAVHDARRDREGGAGRNEAVEAAELELEAALEHEQALVLLLVVLEAQAVALLDGEDLAHVARGLCEDELPPPRLLDELALRDGLGAHSWL